MKKIITLSCFWLSFIVLCSIMGTQTSCQKQNTNCVCVITVDTLSGSTMVPVSNAYVKLYAPHSTAGGTGYTNAAGDVTFNFALPAIFNVAATYKTNTYDSGGSIIQLQIGQTESAIVTMKLQQ
jgi:hypothetical protein